MVTMGVFPFQEKRSMVEPGIEPGTSWFVVRSSDHQATRMVMLMLYRGNNYLLFKEKCEIIKYIL